MLRLIRILITSFLSFDAGVSSLDGPDRTWNIDFENIFLSHNVLVAQGQTFIHAI